MDVSLGFFCTEKSARRFFPFGVVGGKRLSQKSILNRASETGGQKGCGGFAVVSGGETSIHENSLMPFISVVVKRRERSQEPKENTKEGADLSVSLSQSSSSRSRSHGGRKEAGEERVFLGREGMCRKPPLLPQNYFLGTPNLAFLSLTQCVSIFGRVTLADCKKPSPSFTFE